MANPFITHCIVYNDKAEEAAKLYTSIFPDARIVKTRYYQEGFGGPVGVVLCVYIEIRGQNLMLVNGGPEDIFKLTDGVSLYVEARDQEELDRIWEGLLSSGGHEEECGWCRDKFDVPWQIAPAELTTMQLEGTDEQYRRVQNVVLTSKKLDLAQLRKAYNGEDGVGEEGRKDRIW